MDQPAPVRVANLPYILDIEAGSTHSLALDADGRVWAWGDNSHGQLGVGSTSAYASSPVAVSGLPVISDIAAGDGYSMALASDGSLWAWGRNDHGQLGDGTNTDRSQPTQVQGLDGVLALSAGPAWAAAVTADHTLWSWGQGSTNPLDASKGTDWLSPVLNQILDQMRATDVAAGDAHVLVRTTDGKVFSWGQNDHGQLGHASVAQ